MKKCIGIICLIIVVIFVLGFVGFAIWGVVDLFLEGYWYIPVGLVVLVLSFLGAKAYL